MISELKAVADLQELERLFAEVWSTPEPPISSDTLRALAHSGNYVAGARAGGRLLGGLVGWYGGSPPHDLHLHSHILGVLNENRVRGLGFELKQHQRRWCLDRGVKVIEWTFDPLVRRNAYFNLNKLGAHARRYLVNFYGEMTDGINAGEESDRLLISWRLDSPRAEGAAAGSARDPHVEELERAGARPVLSTGPRGEPVSGQHGGGIMLCQVPDDIVSLRRSDPALARAWRTHVRTALTGAFDAGYEITGVTRSGWYVLERG